MMSCGVSRAAVAVVVATSTVIEPAVFEVVMVMVASTVDPEKAWAPS
jgi:hypothetical protein